MRNTVNGTAFKCLVSNIIQIKFKTISFQKSQNVLVKSVCLTSGFTKLNEPENCDTKLNFCMNTA